jgi:peptidylprolyl isomerase|tara:strand:- start:2444 stop:2914 length:471 start_codon:yes stop_codon:yes gene_type:complete
MQEQIMPSGLKITQLNEGTGETPNLGDEAVVHYILHLGKGTCSSNYDYDKCSYVDDLVDSTYDEMYNPEGPKVFIVGKETPKDELYTDGDCIEGISEALLGMKEGGKCRLVIPTDMAYGEEGASSFHSFHGYRTPPGKDLDIVIELVEVRRREDNV